MRVTLRVEKDSFCDSCIQHPINSIVSYERTLDMLPVSNANRLHLCDNSVSHVAKFRRVTVMAACLALLQQKQK